jgi:hypothetical protein
MNITAVSQVLRCRVRLLLILAAAGIAGCGASPAAPSSGSSLTVSVTDEVTGRLLVDPVFGVTVQLTAANTYSQPVVGGIATFPSIAPGTYRVTTSVEYGYRQFDVLSVVVEGPRTLTLPMRAIDDIVVTDVFVDGQGSIAKGGTINVPPQGISLHYRGRWQPLRYLPSENFTFDASLDVRFVSTPFLSRQLGPTEWEIILPGVLPCAPPSFNSVVPCETTFSAGTFTLFLARSFGPFLSDTLMNRQQSWPLTFHRVP